jgi:hypothetical protein
MMKPESCLSDDRTLDEIREEGDSIVLPGSSCDGTTGMPIKGMLLRCRTEFFLKEEMERRGYRCTIVTGGPARGVETYRNVDPLATEAGQIIKYATEQGKDPARYVPEDFALDTLGNLIFSTKTMLLAELQSPVWVSQDEQVFRLKLIANHWYGRSRIHPLFAVVDDYMVDDPGEQKDNEKKRGARIKADIRRAALRDHSGPHFLEYFRQGLVPLPSHKWGECKWAFEVAIRWLFKHSKDTTTGALRYPAVFSLNHVLETFLD